MIIDKKELCESIMDINFRQLLVKISSGLEKPGKLRVKIDRDLLSNDFEEKLEEVLNDWYGKIKLSFLHDVVIVEKVV